MAIYHWLRVRSAERTWAESYARFSEAPSAGASTWGAFRGLFGLASNELMLVLHADGEAPMAAVADAGFEVTESHAFVPTIRPQRFEPLTRPGLYVFRFFDVDNHDVDEIAQLTSQAWTSFETSDRYEAQPQGLFAQANASEATGVMMLLTWYDGLESWESSRNSSPEAAGYFRRRRALTTRTVAYATRLVDAKSSGASG